jgi:hypothetical protein
MNAGVANIVKGGAGVAGAAGTTGIRSVPGFSTGFMTSVGCSSGATGSVFPASSVPQLVQNFFESSFSWPHFGHFTVYHLPGVQPERCLR